MNQSRALPQDFLKRLSDLEESYLRETDPIRQSGFGGGGERRRGERGVILEATNESGSFLDVGCANGFLLECLVQWAGRRGIALVPSGLDQGPRLIERSLLRLREAGMATAFLFTHEKNSTAQAFWQGTGWEHCPWVQYRCREFAAEIRA